MLLLADDAVGVLSEDHLSQLEGVGTGKLQEHFEAIVDGGGTFDLSGMSAKASGFDESLIEG